MIMQKVIIVDNQDNQIGISDKISVHVKGILHRAFSIMIYNNKNQILLQQRAFNKYHSSGLWTNACCSHPNSEIDFEKQVRKRLQEEIGIDCNLKWCFSFIYKETFENGLTENEFDHVFYGQFEGNPIINENEVADFKWIDTTELISDMKINPNKYSVWFHKIIENSITQNIIEKLDNQYKVLML